MASTVAEGGRPARWIPVYPAADFPDSGAFCLPSYP